MAEIRSDRPATELDEIDITPEMIEAGVDEFCSFDDRYEFPEAAVARVFRAMIRATPKERIHLGDPPRRGE